MECNTSISRRELMRRAARSGLALSVGSMLGWPLLACSSSNDGNASSRSGKRTITLGGLFSQTGSVAGVGQAAALGARLRLDLENQAGGIRSLGGATLQLRLADDQSKPEVSPSVVAKLADSDIPLILGLVGSPSMLNATQEAERQRIPIVNAGSVHDDINNRGFRYTFTICGTAARYTEDFVQKTKQILAAAGYTPNRIGVLYETQIQGPIYANWMKEMFRKHTTWEVTYVDYPLDTTDFSPLLSRLKSSGVDVVVLASYAKDGALILQAMSNLKFNVALVTGCMGGVLNREFVTTAGPLAEAFAGESYWVPAIRMPGLDEFKEAYRNKTSDPLDPFVALGYTAASVAIEALERAGSTNRDAVREALTQVSLEPGQRGCLLPGGVRFAQNGANSAVEGVYYQIFQGTQQTVLPERFAVAKPVVPHPGW